MHEVAGCMPYTGEAKSIEQMHAAVALEIKAHHSTKALSSRQRNKV